MTKPVDRLERQGDWHDIHRSNPVTAPLAVTVSEYGHGKLPTTWTPGDIGVVSFAKMDVVDELIRARERVRCGHTTLAELDHSFCVVGKGGSIVEANEPGVQMQNGSKYRDHRFWILSPSPLDVSPGQRDLCVEFWIAQVGDRYDVLDFVLTQAPIALFGIDYSLHGNRAWICSGLAATGWLKFLPEWSMPSEALTPADICQDLSVNLGDPPQPLGFWARMLDKLVMFGHVFAHLSARPFRAIGAELEIR